MRTSSNCRKRKKQEAMHCRPGIVSENQRSKIKTSRLLLALVRLTTLTARAAHQLVVLLCKLQVFVLHSKE